MVKEVMNMLMMANFAALGSPLPSSFETRTLWWKSRKDPKIDQELHACGNETRQLTLQQPRIQEKSSFPSH